MRSFILGALLSAAISSGALAAPPVLFSCSFGAKQVVVTGGGGAATYQFGPPGRPELAFSVAPNSKKSFYHVWDDGRGRAWNTQLRIVNGAISYVVYNREFLGTAGDPPENYSGLLVLDWTKRLANLRCKSGPGFTDANFDAFPDDVNEAFHIARLID